MENETTTPEETQEDSPLESEQTTDTGSEAVKTQSEDTIPLHRFSEKVEEANTYKTKVEALESEIESLKSKEPEETEPSDWKEVESRAVEKATAKMKADLLDEEEKDRKEEMAIETSFAQLKQIGQDITPEIKKAVLEQMIQTGKSVIDVYSEVKTKIDKDTKTAQIKSESKTPSSKQGSEETPSFSYKDIRGKSLDDIIDESV